MSIALGRGSLSNHSPTPNAAFRAVRDIAAGEQILIDYQRDEAEYATVRREAGEVRRRAT